MKLTGDCRRCLLLQRPRQAHRRCPKAQNKPKECLQTKSGSVHMHQLEATNKALPKDHPLMCCDWIRGQMPSTPWARVTPMASLVTEARSTNPQGMHRRPFGWML